MKRRQALQIHSEPDGPEQREFEREESYQRATEYLDIAEQRDGYDNEQENAG